MLGGLKAISGWLTRETPWFVTGVAVIAYFFPGLFGWVYGDRQTCLLGLIMLTMGMTLGREDFVVLGKRPWDILVGTLAQFLVMPLLAFAVAWALGLNRGLTVGLVLVGCCPGGVSSNIMTYLCGGDVAFSVGMTSVNTLLAPLVTPVLMLWLVGTKVDVDALGLLRSILIVTIGPVGIGFVLNWLFGQRSGYKSVMGVLPGVAVLALGCIVGAVSGKYGHDFVKSGLVILLAVFLHNGLGYVVGYLVGWVCRFSRAKNRTISIEVGMQNAGLATVLAGKHFPMLPEAAVICAVSCMWHSITGAFLAWIFNKADSLFGRRGAPEEGSAGAEGGK